MELTQRIKQRLREVDDWSTVVDELEADAGAASDKSEQSKAFFELARACEDVFLDKARAMQAYQKAFKLDQSNLEALRRARQIYQMMANLEMVTRLMGLELKANRDPELAGPLNYDFGTAQLNLRNVDEAKLHLSAAAEAEPENETYQSRFQETLYDAANWELAIETVYAQLTALTGEDDPLGAQVPNRGPQLSALYMKAARILQQESPEDDRLLPLLFKALEADPRNDEAGYLADTLLATAGQLQHVQKLQDRRVSLIEDDNEKVDMLRSFGDIWDVRLNNPQMAAYFFHQALDLAYSNGALGSAEDTLWNVAAFRKLVATANESGQSDALIPLAERGIASLKDPAERVLLALEAGTFAWNSFEDAATAGRFLGLAVDVAPDHPSITRYQSEVGALEPVELDAFGAPPEAVEEEAAEEEAVEEEAVEEEAVEEEAVEEEAAEEEAVEEEAVEEEAAEEEAVEEEAVEEEAVEEEDVEEEDVEEEDVGEEAVEEEAVEEDAPEPVELGDESFDADQMQLIAKAQEADKKGGKRAIDAWRDAVSKMPDKVFPRARLKQLYADNNKWSNVADLLKDQIKNTPDEDLENKEALHWELIELYRERLRQPGLVVTTLNGLEKVLDAAGEKERLLKVVEEQQSQFESMKRWPDLIGRIRRRAELVDDMEARKELHLQAGSLFLEKFNNQAEAIKSYESVLECDEYDPVAIGKLKELYQRRRDWEKMLAVQQKELALIEDPEERRAQLLEVARVAGQKIKKPAISIGLWSQVLENDPDNVEALENLEHMQEREKNWEALSGTLERLIEVTEDETKKSQYLVKLGLLYADKVKDNASAIRTWEALHEIDPDNRRAQDQLKKLYIAEGDMEALEQFYAKQDKWAEFIRVLEREVDGAEDERRVELQLKIADLYRDKIGKPERAVRALEKALGDGDNLTVAEKLIELYEEAGDERHLAKPLSIKLDNEEDPEARQALLRRLADLAERIAHDPETAFSYYQKALEEDHTATDAREHLERLAESTNQWQALAGSLELAIKEYGDSTDSLPLRLKLAEINEQHMADLDAALAVNQAIVEIDAEEPTALASLERLYLALGREEDLLAVLDTKLSLSNDEEERRATQTRIGSIHEQLGHHDKAIEAYNAVLDSGVEDTEVLGALDRIYPDAKVKAEYYLGHSLYKAGLYFPAFQFYGEVFNQGEDHPYFLKATKGLLDIAAEINDDTLIPGVINKGYSQAFVSFSEDDPGTLDAINYMVGLVAQRQGNYNEAKDFLGAVTEGSPYYLRARYILAIMAVRTAGQTGAEDFSEAIGYFDEIAARLEKELDVEGRTVREEDKKLLRLATLGRARAYYSQGNDKKSIENYEAVTRFSDDWYDAMFESGWAYFRTGEFGKALGMVHSIQSPYFDGRYRAESWVLKATTYFQNCHFDRVRKSIDTFLGIYEPMQEQLKPWLEGDQTDAEMVELVLKGDKDFPEEIRLQIANNRRFLKFLGQVQEVDAEIAKANSSMPEGGFKAQLIGLLEEEREQRVALTGRFARQLLVRESAFLGGFIGQASIIKFETADAERKMLEAGKDITKGPRAQGPRPVVPNAKFQYWEFHGEYWIDELGFYEHSIKDECVEAIFQ